MSPKTNPLLGSIPLTFMGEVVSEPASGLVQSSVTTPELDLQGIRERCDAATEGEWIVGEEDDFGNCDIYRRDGYSVAEATSEDDAEFIAHSRTDVPALLSRVQELEASADVAVTMTLESENRRLAARLDAVTRERDARLTFAGFREANQDRRQITTNIPPATAPSTPSERMKALLSACEDNEDERLHDKVWDALDAAVAQLESDNARLTRERDAFEQDVGVLRERLAEAEREREMWKPLVDAVKEDARAGFGGPRTLATFKLLGESRV